ncbi:MAG: hypothetical protein WC496_11445 [Phycisphaerae bacterium]
MRATVPRVRIPPSPFFAALRTAGRSLLRYAWQAILRCASTYTDVTVDRPNGGPFLRGFASTYTGVTVDRSNGRPIIG